MRTVLATILGATCTLALMSSIASAEIVCNREGDCWHAKQSYHYRAHPEFGLTIHPNHWKWTEHNKGFYRWREHDGIGYWRDGVWVKIR